MPAAALFVFDLDGTLVDSRLDLAESVNEMLRRNGVPELPVDAVGSMVGDGARQLVSRALIAAGLSIDLDGALAAFLEVYHRRLLVHTRPYEGIVEVVTHAAARAPLAVLTNKPQVPTERLLEAFGLRPSFHWVIGGDAAFPRKPDPSALRYLASAAGVPIERTMMIGDSMVDVETARAAGAVVCLARYGFGDLRGPLTLTKGEASVEQPAEIAPLIESFLKNASHAQH
jgi:phosphoglycolate phosphatase